jgi:N-acetylglucosamine malate deacetylase 1
VLTGAPGRRVLIVAPHYDDEVLGVGGTMARLAAEGNRVSVVVVTRGYPPEFVEEVERQTEEEASAAHRLLGVTESIFLGLPAAGLDTIEHRELNAKLGEVVTRLRPEVVFVPFCGDIHLDHQHVFLSSLVVLRPHHRLCQQAIYAYETLSETNWSVPYLMPNFTPNTFIDITEYVDKKIAAMRIFATQIKAFPHTRSAEALGALATFRGSTVGCAAAEAFVLIRQQF